jgi:transporter family-2 protein
LITIRRVEPAGLAAIFIFAGVASALQSRSNGELTQHSGNGVNSALFSFIIGLFILSVIACSSREIRAAITRIPATVRDGSLAWWAVPAGVLGGVFIACASFAVAIVGVALFAVGAVVGQTATALLVDRLGIGPNGRTALSAARVISAGVAVVAVVVAASGSINAEGFSLAAVLAALLGGTATTIQQGLNGRITVASGHPLATTWLNFVFGTLGLMIGTAIGIVLLGDELRVPTPGPWWMWLGGIFGCVFILTAAWAVPRYGVLVFTLATIAGQLTAALALDLLVPVGDNRVEVNLVAGVLLTFAAVGIGALRRRQPA